MKKLLLLGAVALLSSCATTPPMEIPEQLYLSDVTAQLRSGDLTSEALVAELLQRVEAKAALNAMITVNPEALELAKERDRERRRGQSRGPLHGVPLVVKDNIHVAGLANTAGTPALASFVPAQSNGSVEALTAAGAIILGKTNLHELAFGITSANAAYGAVGNPRDPRLMPGGSSGGTAAAIAAGLAPAGLGTDTGGSVRIPAALTGTAGFRPTPGRYPSEGVTPISHTRDTVGVMGGSVADLILLDEAITGTSNQFGDSLEPVRLGLIRNYYFAGLEKETEQQMAAALTRLRDAGIDFVEVELPALGQQVQAGFPIAIYEARRDLIKYLSDYDTGIDLQALAAQVASPDVKGVFGAVLDQSQVPEAVYRSALDDIGQMNADFRQLFLDHNLDAIVFPTTPLTARPTEGSAETVELNGQQVPTFPTYIRNTDPASLAGLPGVSLNAGNAPNGLPVGLELDGPPGGDAQLLQLALRIESLLRQP
ncbi:MAG: indoleacetamide hydrolase [Pseudomonadota bacterium]